MSEFKAFVYIVIELFHRGIFKALRVAPLIIGLSIVAAIASCVGFDTGQTALEALGTAGAAIAVAIVAGAVALGAFALLPQRWRDRINIGGHGLASEAAEKLRERHVGK